MVSSLSTKGVHKGHFQTPVTLGWQSFLMLRLAGKEELTYNRMAEKNEH